MRFSPIRDVQFTSRLEHALYLSERPQFVFLRQVMKEQTRYDAIKNFVLVWQFVRHALIEKNFGTGFSRFVPRDFENFGVTVQTLHRRLWNGLFDGNGERGCAAPQIEHPMRAVDVCLL